MAEQVMDVECARTLYLQFVRQQISEVWAARCCGRLYLGKAPATTCRVCSGSPVNHKIEKPEDLAILFSEKT